MTKTANAAVSKIYCLGPLSAGPFVPPAAPFTPVASCDGSVPGSILLLPLVPLEAPDADPPSGCFAAGPFVLPGAPWTPGPELCCEGRRLDVLSAAVEELGLLMSADFWA